MKEFDLGQPVYFCHCYGEGHREKPYRWGYVKLGFITKKDYVEARNQYLYIVGTLNNYDHTMVTYKTLGPHFIFDYESYEAALLKTKELCEEVDE